MIVIAYVVLLLMLSFSPSILSNPWEDLQLYSEHIAYFFYNNKDIRQQCEQDDSCPYKEFLNSTKCWGYEKKCSVDQRMTMPTCEPDDLVRRGRRTVEDRVNTFWTEADFGYVKNKRDEMKTMCQAESSSDSHLECCKFTRFCRAKNLYMDFRRYPTFAGYDRYKENYYQKGEIGGHCKLNSDLLRAEGGHKSALQSWYAELENFSSLDFKPIEDGHCDVVVDKPVYLIKLDAGVNMYHHYCDFVNLYMSQHLNNSFSMDVYVINHDTSAANYGDFFSDTWKAFSVYPMKYLREFAGQRVCFRQAVFSLLPRMQYGLFYNTPLSSMCEGTGLFRAFSQHVVHRLGVRQHGPLSHKIRITLLARSTKYRKILNQDKLVGALKSVGEFEVKMVDFTLSKQYKFLEQVDIMHNTDIFIGIHGAGLTHLLFQPDWGVVFEIYNCEDRNCYLDLARLRGLLYMTWEKQEKLIQEDEGHHPTLGAHAKFTNYAFDVDEFMRLILKAANHVRNHPAFILQRKSKNEQSTNSQQKEEL